MGYHGKYSSSGRLFFSLFLAVLFLSATQGCGSVRDSGDSDSDTDVDTDTDSDTDADSDTDVDSDTDADTDTDTDTGNGKELSISDIQDPSSQKHPAEGDIVTVTGIVTVDSKEYKGHIVYFIQDQGGNEYSGIYVFASSDTASVVKGDVVEVTGEYKEYYDRSEIDATKVEKTGTADVPAPIKVAPGDIATNGPKAEAYEGVLVKVENVEVTEAPVLGSDNKDHGDWRVTGDLIIGHMYDYSYNNPDDDKRKVGDKFDSITGILDYSFSEFRLEPRDDSDLEGPTN